MSAPTEATILSAFLLPPAPLPAIISLKEFAGLFPRQNQTSLQIRLLYRDLQQQRARLTDGVSQNVVSEVKRGNAQRRAIARARRYGDREYRDDEVDVEAALFGATSNLPSSKSHTLKSILPDFEIAAGDVEDEARMLEDEAEALLEQMRITVGGLSDLRYGRLANGQLREQVLKGLGNLESLCEKI